MYQCLIKIQLLPNIHYAHGCEETRHVHYRYPGRNYPPWLFCLILCLLLFGYIQYLPHAGIKVPECRLRRCHTVVYAWVTLISDILQIYAALLYHLGHVSFKAHWNYVFILMSGEMILKKAREWFQMKATRGRGIHGQFLWRLWILFLCNHL